MSFTINDDVTLTSSASIDNIRISVNTISSTNTDGDLLLAPNGTGNVGIGTSNPQANLHVEGNFLLNAYETNNEGKGIFFRKDFVYGANPLNISITTKDWGSSGSSPDGLLISGGDGVGIHTGSNNYNVNNVRLLVTSAGNVGIGTTSPATKLDVAGSIKADHLSLGMAQYPTLGGNWLSIYAPTFDSNIGDNAPNPEGGILFSNTSSNGSFPWGFYMGTVKYAAASSYPTTRFDIGKSTLLESQFSTTSYANTLSPQMSIDGYGNVGIGTTSPASKLDVSGSIKADHLSLGIKQYPNVGGQWLTINLNTYDGNVGPNAPYPEGGIMFSNIDVNSIFKWGYYMGVVKPSVSDQSTSQRLDIGRTIDVKSQISGGTNGTFIPSVTVFNDKVGIGTTSPAAKLDIGGNTDGQVQAILTRGLDTNFQLQAINESSSSSSGDVVSKFGLRHGTNETALFNFIRGSGASDGSLAIVTNNTERIRVNKDGNVGIGTTSPGRKLHITNTTNTSINLVTLENVSDNTVLGTTKMIVMNNLRNYNSYGNESLTNTCGTDIITVNGDNDVRYSGFTSTELSKLRVEYDYPKINSYTSSSFCIYTNGGSGNTEKIRVTGAGNVGIGTTSPTSRLTINSGSTSNIYAEGNYHGLAVTTGTNYQTIWMGYDGSVDIGYINAAKTGTTVPICLQTRGNNVGIGTTSPTAKLHIYDYDANSAWGMYTNNKVTLNFDTILSSLWHSNTGGRGTAEAAGQIIVRSETDDNYEDAYMAFTVCRDARPNAQGGYGVLHERMRITSDGNVGIGNSSPTVTLDVGGSNTNGKSLQLRSGDNSTSTDSAQIIFSYNNASYNSGGYAHSIRTRHNGSSASGNAIDFWLWKQSNDSSNTLGSLRVMTLDGTGNVGIGTSSPDGKLHIVGSGDHALHLTGDSSAGHAQAYFEGSTYGLSIRTNNTSNNRYGIRVQNSSDAELLYVRNDGNVGIGTSSPGERLDVRGNLRIGASSSSNYIAFYGTYGDGYGSWNHTYIGERIYGGTEQSELLLWKGNDASSSPGPDRIRYTATGGHLFQTTGTAIGTFEQVATNGQAVDRMIITYNGNVGIGTTSPNTRFQVNGYQTFYDIDLLPGYNSSGDKVPAKIILGNEYSPQIRTFYPNKTYTDSVDLEFWTCGQNVATDNMSSRLTIKAQSGNVGIGTTSPATKLDVAGTLKHQGLTLNEGTTPNVDEIKTFTKSLSVSTSWIDTGIIGSDLETGSYIIQVFSHNGSIGQYHSTFTGFMSWYKTVTNSNYYNEVLLHSVGNDITNVLYIRTQLLLGNTNTLKLQIRLSGGSGSGYFTFKFRRMI